MGPPPPGLAAGDRARTRCLPLARFDILVTVRGAIEAIKADFGCLLVAVLFIVIMASTIIFATIFTPPAHNPFV
jgi:hypothetical protein